MAKASLENLGELQRRVVQVLWEGGEGTVQQVRDRLASRKPLAYTTVLSVMQRLEKMGWVTHREEGRAYVYRAARSPEQERTGAVGRLMRRLFGGDPKLMLQHLIEEEGLSDEELAELRRLIDERRKRRRTDERAGR